MPPLSGLLTNSIFCTDIGIPCHHRCVTHLYGLSINDLLKCYRNSIIAPDCTNLIVSSFCCSFGTLRNSNDGVPSEKSTKSFDSLSPWPVISFTNLTTASLLGPESIYFPLSNNLSNFPIISSFSFSILSYKAIFSS